MGEYEPHDSRNVTLKPQRATGEPPRTGPREGETRQQEQQLTELEEDGRGDDVEASSGAMGAADAEAEAALRERAIEADADELDAAAREGRND
jgi:hypothetical protein